MTIFYVIGHVFNLLIYIIKRFAFFLYRFLIFLTKPGARIILPILFIAGVFVFEEKINLHPRAGIENWRIYNDFWRVVEAATGYQRPLNLIEPLTPAYTLMVLALSSVLLLWLVALMLRPIMGAFPIPAPPVRPTLFIPPRPEKVKTYRTRVVAPILTQKAWDGSDKALIDLMEPELQQILSRDHGALDREIGQSMAPIEPSPITSEPELAERLSERPIAPLRDTDIVRPS